jgi:MFS family permease
MSGVIKAGAGFGIMVMPLVANWLILSYGWRPTYTIFAGIILFIVLASQFLKRDPSQSGLFPDGDKKIDVDHTILKESGLSFFAALRSRQIWMLCCIYLFFGFCSQIVLVHATPHALDLGATPTIAASILSIVGGVSIAGRFVMGSASDRIGNRLAHVVCFALISVAFLSLSLSEELWVIYLFAVLYGFAHGGLWAMISPIVAELFGLNSHGAIFGIVFFSCTVGGTVGPITAGYMFDITGNYKYIFIICVIFSVISTIVAVGLTLTKNVVEWARY